LCAEEQRLKIKPMTLVLIELADAEKLDTLRRLDQFREWQSLDEKRYCLVCGNLITGREIQVTAGNRPAAARLPNGTLQFHSNGLGDPTPEGILATLLTWQDNHLPQTELKLSDRSSYSFGHSMLTRFGVRFLPTRQPVCGPIVGTPPVAMLEIQQRPSHDFTSS
jgi:hypothetical protein